MAKILIVDDDLVSLLYMEQILKTLGHIIVDKIKSGPEGVKRSNELKPDIVFMDISMPGEYDGIEAARIIENEINIPVVFITAFEIDQFLNRVEEVRPFGYIMKPFKELEVKAAIYIALYRKQMEEKYKNIIKKYKKSFYFQIVLSNLLIEFNKTNDIFNKLDELLNFIRKTMDIDSIFIYKIDESNILTKISNSLDEKYKDIKIYNSIDIYKMINNLKKEYLEKYIIITDFNIFNEKDRLYFEEINLDTILSNPIFIDDHLYGFLVIGCFSGKCRYIDIRRNLKIISKVISLLIKRHNDSVNIQDKEEKMNVGKNKGKNLKEKLLPGAIIKELNKSLQTIKTLAEGSENLLGKNNAIMEDKNFYNFEIISSNVKKIDDVISYLKLLIKYPKMKK